MSYLSLTNERDKDKGNHHSQTFAMLVAEDKDSLKDKLKEIFGYTQFRGNQEVVIKNILNGRNTFVIMPTGAGKSLCYQLPAMVNDGLAIVISPLIALMKNQVDSLNAYGINARFLNSTLSKGEITRLRKDALAGAIKLLYVAPESLSKEENIQFLQKVNVNFIAIDEAHCISEWGHDFRPEYRKIKTMIAQLGDMPVIALTATATPKVQLDIQKNLQMEEADVFISSFNRKNLYYEVRPKKETKKQLIRFLKEHKGKSGIIYCLSRKKVEEIAELINVNGFKAAPYHAGLDSDVRMKNQDDFITKKSTSLWQPLPSVWASTNQTFVSWFTTMCLSHSKDITRKQAAVAVTAAKAVVLHFMHTRTLRSWRSL